MTRKRKPFTTGWAIQCYDGEIDDYSISPTEAEAWEKFLSRTLNIITKEQFIEDGWKAIQVFDE